MYEPSAKTEQGVSPTVQATWAEPTSGPAPLNPGQHPVTSQPQQNWSYAQAVPASHPGVPMQGYGPSPGQPGPPQGYGPPPGYPGPHPQGYGIPPAQPGMTPQGYGVSPEQYAIAHAGAAHLGVMAPSGAALQAQAFQMHAAMANQQQPKQWMPKPTVINCPPGLENLTQLDEIVISQLIDMVEVMTNIQVPNKYEIKNPQEQLLFYAAEESDNSQRQCCNQARGFTMRITDSMNQDVIQGFRSFRPCACSPLCCQCCACCECCSNDITIESPPGQVVGYVRQIPSCGQPKYKILDAQEQTVLTCVGAAPFCVGPGNPVDIDFFIYSADGAHEVGKVTKKFTNYLQEALSNANTFALCVPKDLDVKTKAVLMGLVFLIDYMFFQVPKTRNQNRRR